MKLNQFLAGTVLALNTVNCAGADDSADPSCGDKTITVIDTQSSGKANLIKDVRLEEGDHAEGVFTYDFLRPIDYDASLLLETREQVQTLCEKLIEQAQQYPETTITRVRCGTLLINEDGSLNESIGAGYKANEMEVSFYEYPLHCSDFLQNKSNVNPGQVHTAQDGEFYYTFSEHFAEPTSTKEGDQFKEVCWPHVIYYPASTHSFYCDSWDQQYTSQEICEAESVGVDSKLRWDKYAEMFGCYFVE
jgi:hypothetical protein